MHTSTASAATAANVRAEIARRGLPQGRVADQVGISQSQFSKRLRGLIPFDINELDAVAKVLGLPLADLIPADTDQAGVPA